MQTNSPQISELLIVGACEEELRCFRENHSGLPRVNILNVGIGAVSAAVELTAYLAKLPESDVINRTICPAVIFVGTVGAIAPEIELGSLVIATECISADLASARNESYLPKVVTNTLGADKFLIDALTKLLGGKYTYFIEPIYCTPSITSTETGGADLAVYTGARFENLELFGIASACEAFQIPWTSLSLVTNHVGPMGHTQWQKNNRLSSEITTQIVDSFLESNSIIWPTD